MNAATRNRIDRLYDRLPVIGAARRAAAVQALARDGTVGALDALADAAVGHPDTNCRIACLAALAGIGQSGHAGATGRPKNRASGPPFSS